jgi:dipeptidyl aminopeptidase/acylaminoacyl peptidase
LARRTAIIFAPLDSGEDWITPSFSPRSQEIAFVVARRLGESQIAKIGTNGTGLLVLTKSSNIKRSPSFAPSGHEIIYSARERQSGVRGDWFSSDAYVVNLADGLEHRLTDLRVRDLKWPSFTHDGQSFTFATVGGALPRAGAPAAKIELEQLYPDRTVFIAPLNAPRDFRPIVEAPASAWGPQPIRGGKIAVVGRVNDMDKLGGTYAYDLFLTDGKGLRRLTHFRTVMSSYGISPSGRSVVFVVKEKREDASKLMFWQQGEEQPVELPIGRPRVLQVTQ